MTKADIVKKISKTTGLASSDVAAVIDGFMQTVIDSVAAKDNVTLRGFGTFIHREASAKKARDITKGETITIPARGVVKFKAAQEFKAALN